MARAFTRLTLSCFAAGLVIVMAEAVSAQTTNGTTTGATTPSDTATWQADRTRSDPGLGGVTMQCSTRSFNVAVKIAAAGPPHAHAKVKLAAADPSTPGTPRSVEFDATVAAGGAIRLPMQAAELLSGAWKSQNELRVEVTDNGATISGVVPVAGLGSAVANCPTRVALERALNRRLLPPGPLRATQVSPR
jgi:hypothetical protein